MKKQIMFLLARTPIHVGAGNSVGVVDSPIMRERHSKTPIIPGSSLKGVISDLWNGDDFKRTDEGKELFGNDDSTNSSAGKLLIGEARVLAFPVRSAKNSFAWITSPFALEKFARESDISIETSSFANLGENDCFSCDLVTNQEKVVLEEYLFNKKGDATPIAKEFKKLFEDNIWNTIVNRLVIVNDELFSYFVQYACEVVTRIKIDNESGVTAKGALFNQEQCPSETLFYSVIGSIKDKDNLEKLTKKINETGAMLQIGGDASIGLGFCSTFFSEVK